jgi:hypothetical protein
MAGTLLQKDAAGIYDRPPAALMLMLVVVEIR